VKNLLEPKVLVIEDDVDINRLVSRYLTKEGYNVTSAFSGYEGIMLATSFTYNCVILDLMLPNLDGHQVLMAIKSKSNTPVIILSAKGGEVDKIIGLESGADDYVSKPFSIGELMARVKVQLRKKTLEVSKPKELLEVADLQLNLVTYQASIGNKVKSLTSKEFDILKLLMSYPTKVFTKAQIFQHVWQDNYVHDDNTVMVHIRRLREKIEDCPSQPRYLITVWGIGYKIGVDKLD
jgi:DNA-binding response OmpR family regulator